MRALSETEQRIQKLEGKLKKYQKNNQYPFQNNN